MEFKLRYNTPIEWAHQAMDGIEDFLQDHADAERKVANMCLSLIAHYPDKKEIIGELTQTAVEELLHFKQVYAIMHKRNIPLVGEFKIDPYMKGMSSMIREGSDERLLDRLILASVAEMRGVERFGLLGEVATDPEIQKFYTNLHLQEKEHVNLFLELANHYYSEEEIKSRLNDFLEKEAEVTEFLPWRPAIH